ncbi:hypothetical protein QTP70_015627 [Hemibagrus guttatus]|uniref:Uncharacterized protein n=1 Tax=Hemibagrus guttatus TaxID=175788 RepID=A0AAE0UPN1_9TELE|nr:hypothetical protein QTP70_015627 [Hemibagrus guttatus]
MAAPMSLALFSVIFLQISSSYEQVPAFVEGSSDEAASQDSQIREYGVGGESQSVSYDHGSLFTAEEMRPALQPRDWRPLSPQPSRRRLLQYGGIMPYSPLNVVYNGKTCILFRARKLAIRYRNHTLVDLTQRVFGPDAIVDTRGSFCSKDKAT